MSISQRRRDGLTLLEVAVSVGIIALILVVAIRIMLSAEATSATVVARVDLDQTGRRVLAQLRRELRQSGQDLASASEKVTNPDSAETLLLHVGAGSANNLKFQRRIALASADPLDDWGMDGIPRHTVRYWLEPDGLVTHVAGGPFQRFRLVRERLDAADVVQSRVNVCSDITQMTVSRDLGSHTVKVVIRFTTRNPIWDDGGLPDPVHREFIERIAFMNG